MPPPPQWKIQKISYHFETFPNAHTISLKRQHVDFIENHQNLHILDFEEYHKNRMDM